MPRVMALCDRMMSKSEGLKNLIEGQSKNKTYCGGQIEKSIRSVIAESMSRKNEQINE